MRKFFFVSVILATSAVAAVVYFKLQGRSFSEHVSAPEIPASSEAASASASAEIAPTDELLSGSEPVPSVTESMTEAAASSSLSFSFSQFSERVSVSRSHGNEPTTAAQTTTDRSDDVMTVPVREDDFKKEHYHREGRDLTRFQKTPALTPALEEYFTVAPEDFGKFRDEKHWTSLSPSLLRVGVYIEDVKSGKTLEIRADEDFYAASCKKLPVCSVAVRMANIKLLSLDDSVMYLPNDQEGGSGVIQNYPPRAYTIRSLMEYIGIYSDNIAANMLIRKLENTNGKSYYRQQMEQETGRPFQPENIYTPRQLANAVKSVCAGYDLNPALFEEMIKPFENTEFREFVIKNMPVGSVFSKIGTFYPESGICTANEIGIIYGEFPIIFSIMTEWNGDGGHPFDALQEIGRYLFFFSRTGRFSEALK